MGIAGTPCAFYTENGYDGFVFVDMRRGIMVSNGHGACPLGELAGEQ